MISKSVAAAFQTRWLAEPIERLHTEGHELSYNTLLHLTTKAAVGLEDLDERWWEGTATGELLKTVWALYKRSRRKTPRRKTPRVSLGILGRKKAISFNRPPLGRLVHPGSKV
jgi:hypothetical protein